MQRSDGAKPKVHAGVDTRQPRPTHPDKLWGMGGVESTHNICG